MKKFIFIFIVLAGAGLLILLSFSRESMNSQGDLSNIDFHVGEKLYKWNADRKNFVETSLSGTIAGLNTFYLHRFSPIDGIYYRSDAKKPFLLEKKAGVNTVTFSSGIFVCNIQTGLEKYEFHLGDITLIPKGRGVFLIDTTQEQITTFSFDAFLETKLVSGKNRAPVTNFTLFPSLLFRHNPKNTLELKEADILRISIIDSIRYLDMKTPDDSKVLFPGGDGDKKILFLHEVQKDITDNVKSFIALYNSILEQDDQSKVVNFILDDSNIFLINDSKKDILLKNKLIVNIRNLLKNKQKLKEKSLSDNIVNVLAEMKTGNMQTYNEGLSILKQYYQISIFSHYTNKDRIGEDSPILSLTEKIIMDSIPVKTGEYYTYFANLFSVYYFFSLSQENLSASFELILQKLVDNKVLSKNEFLPFAFFVTQYLSSGPIVPNENALLIITQLYKITNDYYINNNSDDTKIASIISTTFYNYTRIFTKMYGIFLDTFVDKTSRGLLFKKEYISGDATTFDQSMIDTLVSLIAQAKEDVESKKNILASKKLLLSDPRVTDSYSLLVKSIGSFDTFLAMFTNYSKYLNDFNLNENNKGAKGIYIAKEIEMSKENLIAYLKNFNNIDISSLQIVNNFQKDGFYEVQVSIVGNIFTFKLWEKDHVIADISFVDTVGVKHTFPNIIIPLDKKKDQLGTMTDSVEDPAIRYKNDFKNFFEITFLRADTTSPIATTTETATTKSSVTPEIQLFIQNELINKDFKNIKYFLPIEFKNTHVSIDSGNYIISLSGIEKSFMGEVDSYLAVINSNYLFNRHSFSKLSLNIKKEGGDDAGYEFNGTTIEILPARISLLELPESLKHIGYYLDSIRESYNNQQKIVIDLYEKKVFLDNTPFLPKFPVP